MKKALSVRSGARTAGIALVGAAAVVAAAPAGAQVTTTAAPAAPGSQFTLQGDLAAASAYCVGTAYTITVPAAQAAAMVAQLSLPPSGVLGDVIFDFGAGPTTPQGTSWATFTNVPYVAGQDVTVQWTPQAAGAMILAVYAEQPGWTFGGEIAAAVPVSVVQTAPDGSSCVPAPTTTTTTAPTTTAPTTTAPVSTTTASGGSGSSTGSGVIDGLVSALSYAVGSATGSATGSAGSAG